jgi:hypothetical protein
VASHDHGDQSGGPQSITTLSPVEHDRVAELHWRLRFVAFAPGVGRPLLELGTVQYARWLVFSHLPAPDGSGRPWRLNWRYLLFDASYDGSKSQYVDAFSDLLPLRLTRLFGTCFGFEANVEQAPGSDRRVIPARAFERFIEQNELAMDRRRHYWYARSDSVATVRQALAIERVTRRCDRRGDALGRAQTKVQALALGPPAMRPTLREATLGPWQRRLRPAAAVNPLLLAIPVKDASWKELKLTKLPRTHFARVVGMPATMQQDLGHPDPDRLECDYLLFSFDHDGTSESFISLLAEPGVSVRKFFSCCVGFEKVEDDRFALRDWIRNHRLKVQYYLAGVPPRPVREVSDLVEDRELIRRSVTFGAVGLE